MCVCIKKLVLLCLTLWSHKTLQVSGKSYQLEAKQGSDRSSVDQL